MRTKLLLPLLFLGVAVSASEGSFTVLPRAAIRYHGEGKMIPERYANRYEGTTNPVYRLDASQDFSPGGYWSLALWYTGEFGGGKFGTERVEDASGGTYQTSKLNVSFTNLFIDYHKPLANLPVEALIGISDVREHFKREDFTVQGTRFPNLDEFNEISAEGFGFGLAGRHGDRFYARWRVAAYYYIMLFDSKTDSSAGQVFQTEGGVGWRFSDRFSVEVGGLRQFWFIPDQGNRRLSAPGTDGAIFDWNRNETVFGGAYFRLQCRM
jgi:hypothetical protein